MLDPVALQKLLKLKLGGIVKVGDAHRLAFIIGFASHAAYRGLEGLPIDGDFQRPIGHPIEVRRSAHLENIVVDVVIP